MRISITSFCIINLGAFISALGTIFIKRLSENVFSSSDRHMVVRAISDYNLWLGGVCYVIPIVFWIYLLKDMEVTTLQPLLSVVYIYSIILAYYFLSEVPTISKCVGIVFISIGVYFVSAK